jgi:hypothetical protein
MNPPGALKKFMPHAADAVRMEVVNLRRVGCRAGTMGRVAVSANRTLRWDSEGQVISVNEIMFLEEEHLRVKREPCRTAVGTEIISSIRRRLSMCSGDLL